MNKITSFSIRLDIPDTDLRERDISYLIDKALRPIIDDNKFENVEIDVVDTTGCGDAFDAGMIAAIVKGFDLEKALKFATITSGLVATGLGSDAGIKSFEDSLEKMNNLKQK